MNQGRGIKLYSSHSIYHDCVLMKEKKRPLSLKNDFGEAVKSINFMKTLDFIQSFSYFCDKMGITHKVTAASQIQ